ncbi:glycosyltransferase [Solicola sp. PLA-1-18]|uniref:glycosyltransferase n=1 Tax=Solicola sp. PLA-1-18 TaxID=3380532 RepID=UPI003B7C413B
MIGYYAHHVGSGHLVRAGLVAGRLERPVALLSSRVPTDLTVFDHVAVLPRDDEDARPVDVTANGALHFAPSGHGGYGRRMEQLAAWVSRHEPEAVVVDVSVEVAVLVRTLGVPVVLLQQPGDRLDQPHELSRQLATALVAPWPREVYDPSWLAPHLDRTTFVDAISRYAGRPVPVAGHGHRVLVVGGGDAVGGTDVAAAAAATPGWTWSTAGVTGDDWRPDLWADLAEADVVVTHAGQNALADVATAGRPAVVVASPRPHDEQVRTTRALDAAGIAVGVESWPDASAWPALLGKAQALGGGQWRRWASPDALDRLCAVVDEVASR